MGNNRNKRKREFQERALPTDRKKILRESDHGSYYNICSTEDNSSSGELYQEDDNTESDGIISIEGQIMTSSQRKIQGVLLVNHEGEMDTEDHMNNEEITTEGSRIFDISLLCDALQTATKCSVCDSLGLSLKETNRKGWASTMYLCCSNCKAETRFSTSRHVMDDKTKSTVINRSLVLGMRSIGRGRKAADILSAHLGLPSPLWTSSWADQTRILDEAAGNTLDVQLSEATKRLKKTKVQLVSNKEGENMAELTEEQLDNVTVDCAASFDGSWKSRGFHSRHGFVSAISADTGEVLDCIYISSLCRECEKWTRKKDTTEYLDFVANHFPSCYLNHTGSAQSMEVEGIKRLYERSEERGLRYTTYVGDGDSRSFTVISRQQPYGPEVEIKKEECIGHIQKRMGTRLRSLIAKSKGQKLSDGKGLQGAGRLTLARVNAFQRFYGHTLRMYAGDPEMASRTTMAMLSHYSGPPDHSMCPEGAASWCKFKTDELLGTETYTPPKQPLPPAVVEHIKPVFKSLSSVNLLQQTQKALTQNANESLHHLLWSLAPKEQYNSSAEVSLAVKLAVMRFNCGLSETYERLFLTLGMTLTRNAKKSLHSQDRNRLRSVAYAASEKHKEKRAEQSQAKFKDRGFVPVDYRSGAFHEGLKREPPKCSSCKKPRKGHPRGRCTKELPITTSTVIVQ